MKKFLCLSLALGLVASAFAAPEIGKPAPDFTLKDAAGKTHSLADLKGKTVVLEWVNYGCPFVKKHYGSKNMQTLQKDAIDKGVVWLAICSSAPGKQGHLPADQVEATNKTQGSNVSAYLLDEDGTVGKLYEAKTTPEMFIINKDGVLVYKGAIDSKADPNPESIASSTNYVKVALDEVLVGKPVSTSSTKPYGCSVKY